MFVINEQFGEIIVDIANQVELDPDSNDVIDLFTCNGGPELDMWEFYCDTRMCDGIHPNDAGLFNMASCVYRDMFGQPMPTENDDRFGWPSDHE